jgi:hypothetical protein
MFKLPKVNMPSVPSIPTHIDLPKIPSLPHVDLNDVIKKVGGQGNDAYEKIMNAFKKFSTDGQTVKFLKFFIKGLNEGIRNIKLYHFSFFLLNNR